MNTAQPIRNQKDLNKFCNYYRERQKPRNQVLLILGLNTALRISDLLSLRWNDVYDSNRRNFRRHVSLVEKKTGKTTCIYMNETVQKTLAAYKKFLECEKTITPERFLFENNTGTAISRVQAYRIVRRAAEDCEISDVISPHSLRKTFGYHAWKQGVAPALLTDIYNHSSFTITKRYLGIGQDDRDEVFKKICL